MCYLFGMAQVQINLRCSPEQLAAIDAALGGMKRNAFCLEAVMARVAVVGVLPPPVAVEVPLSRPSARAPRGCRVVGVPRELLVPVAVQSIGGEPAEVPEHSVRVRIENVVAPPQSGVS